MNKKTYSEKVSSAMAKRKLKKAHLMVALDTTQPTLDSRFKENNWRLQEIEILNKLLKIRN